ncbi:DUF6979 family protein [Pseudenterobacter timonensis]|uniref:Transcriptional regulator, AbiEi antitoxin, Type IV TA system n=1 Tax=Pseudenterobacter timonensis TaxID=1755099 RepID=A0ABV4A1D9_9ENTR
MKASQTRYGSITLQAIELISAGSSPVEAWLRAVSGKEKGCPKSAFLSLCQFGWVKNVPRGLYLSPQALNGMNKEYTIRAAQIVMADTEATHTPPQLWKRSISGLPHPPANHNQQMNVVLALKEAGVLVKGDMP